MGNYIHYGEEQVTKEILNRIKVGDLIKINDWKKPLRVYGVSENYFCMARKAFGKWIYSVCEKKKWNGIRYNAMRGGMFHCGTDDYIFGGDFDYDFEEADKVKEYLKEFESGKTRLSFRTSVPIYDLYIKGR